MGSSCQPTAAYPFADKAKTNNLLTINHTLTEVNVKGNTELHATDSTKNKSSRRTLPLSESVKVRLLALKAQQEENRKLCGNSYNKDWLDYVFVNEVGDIIRPSYIESVFPRILKKCGLEHRRFHDLRHTLTPFSLATSFKKSSSSQLTSYSLLKPW